MRWLVRFIAAVVTAVSGAVVAFDSSSLKDRGWPQPAAAVVLASIGAYAVCVFWQFVDAEIERRRVRRRTELSNEINRIMFPVWYKVRSVSQMRQYQERIGVHVWMVPSWHWSLIPEQVRAVIPERWRARLWVPRMWRACDLRLKKDQHAGTDIRWKRDVGVIGKCWRERQRQYVDLSSLWGSVEMSEAQWRALPSERKIGLSYGQYRRVHQKYHSVLVVPIFKDHEVPDSRFIGCVVIDSLATHPVNLNVAKPKSLAHKAAERISARVSPISGK